MMGTKSFDLPALPSAYTFNLLLSQLLCKTEEKLPFSHRKLGIFFLNRLSAVTKKKYISTVNEISMDP